MLAKSILEGPYQYKLIQEPGEPTRTPSTAPYSCPQTEEELTADEAKQVVYDDQAMQLLLLGLLDEATKVRAKRLAKTHDPLALFANTSYPSPVYTPEQPSPTNTNNVQPPPIMDNNVDVTDLVAAMNMAYALMSKAFKLHYSPATNNKIGSLCEELHKPINEKGFELLSVKVSIGEKRRGCDASTCGRALYEVPQYDNYYENDMFTMFAHEKQHTELPKSIQGTYMEQ
ncbi:hypothetical protein Tco_1027489 [Tanacetum coccineum]